jgi:type II secretion system protein I
MSPSELRSVGATAAQAPVARGARCVPTRRAGTTLVEVMVTMVVLGVGLVSVMRAFSTCSANVSLIRGETVAETFASSMMAQMREDPTLLLSEDEGEIGPEHPGFTWQRELRETDEPGVLAVRLTVQWRARAVRRDYTLVSLVETARFR